MEKPYGRPIHHLGSDVLFHDTLKDASFAEGKIIDTLPKMRDASKSKPLKDAFIKQQYPMLPVVCIASVGVLWEAIRRRSRRPSSPQTVWISSAISELNHAIAGA